MDTASIKQAAVVAIAPHLPPQIRFLPTHPIAGGETSGIHAARADLFQGRRAILTPLPTTESTAVLQAATLWQHCGARVEQLTPELHDQIYAAVSHLPHLVAFALEDAALTRSGSDEIYKRFVRLCSANRTLWAAIFTLNAEALRACLVIFKNVLSQITHELAQGSVAFGDQPSHSDDIIATTLLPRIIASCLIATVAAEERRLGLSIRRYAGAGLVDMTAPLQESPETAFEDMSNHAGALAQGLGQLDIALQQLAARYLK